MIAKEDYHARISSSTPHQRSNPLSRDLMIYRLRGHLDKFNLLDNIEVSNTLNEK